MKITNSQIEKWKSDRNRSSQNMKHEIQTTLKNTKTFNISKRNAHYTLYAKDMILYTENLKDSTQKLLELINEFRRVIVGYKINIQKLVAFLYTNNQIMEKQY